MKPEQLQQNLNETLEKIFNSNDWKELPFFLHISDIADFLNLSSKTIIREIKSGKINGVIIASKNKRCRYLVLKTALTDYIKRSVV